MAWEIVPEAIEIAHDIHEMMPTEQELDDEYNREKALREGSAPAIDLPPEEEETSMSSSSVAHEEVP